MFTLGDMSEGDIKCLMKVSPKSNLQRPSISMTKRRVEERGILWEEENKSVSPPVLPLLTPTKRSSKPGKAQVLLSWMISSVIYETITVEQIKKHTSALEPPHEGFSNLCMLVPGSFPPYSCKSPCGIPELHTHTLQ